MNTATLNLAEELIKIIDRKYYSMSRYSDKVRIAIHYEIKMIEKAIDFIQNYEKNLKRKEEEIEYLKKENWVFYIENEKLKKTDYGQFLRNKDDIYKTMVNMIIEENKLFSYLINVNKLLEIQVEISRLRDEDLEGFDENVINQIKDLFKEFKKYNENFKKNDVGG
jgi:hypothetical protein